MTTLPSISIVTPSFNQAAFLEETILSVVTQSYPRLHYSVLDAGSNDGSQAIMEKYADRIQYMHSKPDAGQSDAIATGFALSDGEILGWLNSDDYFLPGALHAVGSYFANHPNMEALSCGCLTVDADSKLLSSGFCHVTKGVAASFDRFRYLESQDGVYQPAVFWRRKAYDAVGGLDRSLRFTMDLDLFTRLAARRRFGRLRRFVACFRIHGESKSSTIQDVRRAELTQYRKRYGTSEQSALYRRLRYWQFRIPSLARKVGLKLEAMATSRPSVSVHGDSDAYST